MKYLLSFIAGAIVGWLVKIKQQTYDDWGLEEWLKTHPPANDSSLDDFIDRDELTWVNSLGDTQPIKVSETLPPPLKPEMPNYRSKAKRVGNG